MLLLTPETYAEKLRELEGLLEELTKVRKQKTEAIVTSRGNGLNDNFDYEQAILAEDMLMLRIKSLKDSLKNVEIVEKEDDASIVQIGSKVSIQIKYDEEDEENLLLTLCATSDLEEDTVSLNSPIGITIFKKKKGFMGTVKLNDGDVIIKILDIY